MPGISRKRIRFAQRFPKGLPLTTFGPATRAFIEANTTKKIIEGKPITLGPGAAAFLRQRGVRVPEGNKFIVVSKKDYWRLMRAREASERLRRARGQQKE